MSASLSDHWILSEGVGVTLVRGDERLARPGMVGRGVRTQVRILDDDGDLVPPGTPAPCPGGQRSGLAEQR
jgi:hypothetical protein